MQILATIGMTNRGLFTWQDQFGWLQSTGFDRRQRTPLGASLFSHIFLHSAAHHYSPPIHCHFKQQTINLIKDSSSSWLDWPSDTKGLQTALFSPLFSTMLIHRGSWHRKKNHPQLNPHFTLSFSICTLSLFLLLINAMVNNYSVLLLLCLYSCFCALLLTLFNLILYCFFTSFLLSLIL